MEDHSANMSQSPSASTITLLPSPQATSYSPNEQPPTPAALAAYLSTAAVAAMRVAAEATMRAAQAAQTAAATAPGRINELEQQVAQLEEQIQAAFKQADDAESRAKMAMNLLKNNSEEIDRAWQKSAELEERLDEATEQFEEDKRELESSLEEAIAQLDKEKKNAANKASSDAAAYVTAASKESAAAAEIAEAKRVNEELQKRLDEVSAQLKAEKGKTAAAAAASAAEITELRVKVARLEDDLKKTLQIASEAENPVEAGENLKDSKNDGSTDVEQSTIQAAEEWQKKLDEIAAHLQTEKEKTDAEKSTNEALKGENESLKGELDDLRKKHDLSTTEEASTDLFALLPLSASESVPFDFACARIRTIFDRVRDHSRLITVTNPSNVQRRRCELCSKSLQGVQIIYHFLSRAHAMKMSGNSISTTAMSYWMERLEHAAWTGNPLPPPPPQRPPPPPFFAANNCDGWD